MTLEHYTINKTQKQMMIKRKNFFAIKKYSFSITNIFLSDRHRFLFFICSI